MREACAHDYQLVVTACVLCAQECAILQTGAQLVQNSTSMHTGLGGGASYSLPPHPRPEPLSGPARTVRSGREARCDAPPIPSRSRRALVRASWAPGRPTLRLLAPRYLRGAGELPRAARFGLVLPQIDAAWVGRWTLPCCARATIAHPSGSSSGPKRQRRPSSILRLFGSSQMIEHSQ